MFPDVIWHTEQPIVRTAPAPLFLLSRLVREHGLQGRAHRRGLRRDARRLRHLQGSEGPPLLGAAPGLALAARAAEAAVPVHDRACRASRRRTCGRSSTSAPEDLASPFFSHLPRWELTARTKRLLLGRREGGAGRIRRSRAARSTLPAALRRLGPVLPGAVPRDARACCPATSCRARATACRWPTRSRAAARSSTIASSSSPGRLPPRLKMKVLNEKYLLKQATARPAAGISSRRGPSSRTARRRCRASSTPEKRAPGSTTSTSCCRRRALAGRRLVRPRRRSRSWSQKARDGQRDRRQGQHGAGRHPVDPADRRPVHEGPQEDR